jgi:hypothetical protein
MDTRCGTKRLEIGSLLREREEQQHRLDDLRVENLRLQLELERYKKYYYGPRADQLRSSGELAQMLLEFSEALERKPVNPADLPPHREPEEELRRVKRRRGRRHLANFDHLPVTTRVYELSRAARLSRLWHRAQGSRRGRELADRISAWLLRTHPACA